MEDTAHNEVTLVGVVIEVRVAGPQDTESLAQIKHDIHELSKVQPRDVLVDMTEVLGTEPLPDGLDTYFEGLPYKRYAIFGGNTPTALRTKHLLESIEDESVKFFRHEEDARAWLATKPGKTDTKEV